VAPPDLVPSLFILHLLYQTEDGLVTNQDRDGATHGWSSYPKFMTTIIGL